MQVYFLLLGISLVARYSSCCRAGICCRRISHLVQLTLLPRPVLRSKLVPSLFRSSDASGISCASSVL